MSESPEPGEASGDRLAAVRGSNQSGLRAHNQRLALTVLRIRGPTAKAEIARLSGLSAQTVSVIMRGLEREGLIERGDPVRGKIGQPSVPMRLAPAGAFFFGLQVGRRSADLILVDFLGRVAGRVHTTYPFPTPEGTIRFVQDSVERLTGQLAPRNRARLAGLGVAIPFYLWQWGEDLRLPSHELAAWRGRDIRREIAQLFDFPVYLQNDASCACGAELVFGGRDHPADFLHFFIGYVIGGGIVLNNTLFTGRTGNAGALGPLLVPAESEGVRPLMSVASLYCLEQMILEAGGDTQALWDSTAGWAVDDAALGRWIDGAAHGIAHAIAAACSIIDFELVVIDGRFPREVRTSLTDRVREQLAVIDLSGLVAPRVREGKIGPDARALGAASLPLSQRFMVDLNALLGADRAVRPR